MGLPCDIVCGFMKQNCISFSKPVLWLSNMCFSFLTQGKHLVKIQLHCSYGVLPASIFSIVFESFPLSSKQNQISTQLFVNIFPVKFTIYFAF